MTNKKTILAKLQDDKVRLSVEAKRRTFEKKLETFNQYGGCRCACCGETDPKFLTLDHVNGDGAAQRKLLGAQGRGSNFYTWLKKNGYPPGFQVLCFNCNCGRAHNNGICPHVERRTTIGHSFEQSRPEHSSHTHSRPEGHGSADQKYDKGMRSPWLSQFPQGGNLESPAVDEGVSSNEGGM